MRLALPAALVACAAACATPAPAPPAPPAPAGSAVPLPEPPAIQTTSIAPSTAPPAPSLDVALPAPAEVQPLPMALSRDQVEKTFSHHRRFFNHLYAERVKARPKLKGTMLVSFLINPDGSTRDAALVSSTLGDPVFEKEVLKQIALTNFPPATGVTPVERYPLDFSLQPK
jgi:TonB family protein